VRLALFGSPGFALPVLEALREHHHLALVVTQPDKPSGRGLKLTPPPLAARARELGVRLEQPRTLKRNHVFFDLLRELELDAAVTAAYGKILPPELLKIPARGFLNVHASLLPKYRGAAPIQWALINGERQTGVTIMQTEAGLDTGPIRLQKRLAIRPEETAPTLADELAHLGAEALLEALEELEQGTLPCLPQDDNQASYAPLLKREDGRIRWRESAEAIVHRYRGVLAWPGSWTVYRDKVLKVLELEPQMGQGEPGNVLDISTEGVLVAAGEGAVLLQTVQPAGKAKMSARDWANGYGVRVGQRFEE
jgi:methionyl-tRNA formyltransferase